MDRDQRRGDILYIGPSAEVRRFIETLYLAGLNVRPGRAGVVDADRVSISMSVSGTNNCMAIVKAVTMTLRANGSDIAVSAIPYTDQPELSDVGNWPQVIARRA